jgi:hypothetical protein
MQWFCRITYLGILFFNFSSKNYRSKVYTYLEKLVILVTLSTEKLSLLFWIFLRFVMDLTRSSWNTTRVKNHFARRPLERFELHKTALDFNTQDPTRMRLKHRGPGGAWELSASEGSPELAHKRHWTAIELTTEWLAVVARPERSSASGGDGTGAARPRRCEVRRG